jgi:hypothetical protein
LDAVCGQQFGADLLWIVGLVEEVGPWFFRVHEPDRLEAGMCLPEARMMIPPRVLVKAL